MPEPYIGDSASVKIMSIMDALKPDLRALVHEYGFAIVAAMLDQTDCRDVEVLRADLETWRERQQEKLLAL